MVVRIELSKGLVVKLSAIIDDEGVGDFELVYDRFLEELFGFSFRNMY